MKLECNVEQYRVRPGAKVRLRAWRTNVEPLYSSKQEYRDWLEGTQDQLRDLQNLLFAHDRYALLLIFQGMDTAGKDGAIKHVMSGVNPQGCQVFSFKQPSHEELDHDFLWRTTKCLPERGRIGIFNRSYYEEVLIVRVDPAIFARQRLPEEFVHPKRIWNERYQDIVNFEDYLHRNGTRVVKFFLHLSKEEQRLRFLARIDAPHKNWKLTRADIDVRKQWDAFQSAYETCLGATSTEQAPWYVIPADDKRNARLIVARAIVQTLKSMPLAYPSPAKGHRKELERIRSALQKEAGS
jgi:PPK2 family polyphosphate:nucleotide phosphotransferase